MATQKGIDISKWQESVNFAKVKAAGIQFAILREGYRKAIDGRFLEYVKGCNANGIPIHGVYHFLYSLSKADAVAEAKSCIANIQKAGLDKKSIIVFADFEYDTVKNASKNGVKLGKTQCIEHTKAFCEYVESQGYKAGIYSNIDYYRNMYEKSLIDKYVFWLADYTGGPDYDCTYQQYTSSGKVSGINGNVDMNYYYGEKKTDSKKEEKTVGVTAQDIINVMAGWVGKSRSAGTHHDIIDLYNSYMPRARGYAVTYSDAYCDTTVSAAFIKLKAVSLIGGTECGVENHVQIFKSAGIWEENGSVTPQPGWIIVYNWDDATQPNDGYADHIGIVEKVSGGYITCIEGNMNGGVVGRIIVVVVGHKCTFGVCQVTGLDGKEFCRLVLDVGSVVDGGRIRGFVVGFEAYVGRPLFVELDFKIQVKGGCVGMVQVVFYPDIARVGIKFHFTVVFDLHLCFGCSFVHASLEHVKGVSCGIGHFGRIRVFGC